MTEPRMGGVMQGCAPKPALLLKLCEDRVLAQWEDADWLVVIDFVMAQGLGTSTLIKTRPVACS